MDIKLNKARLSIITQSGRFLGNMIGKSGREALMNLAVPLTKDVLPKLAIKANSSTLDKFEN